MCNMARTGKPIGRPTAYNPEEHPKAARLLTGNGSTLIDLAESFGVAPSTIGEWRNAHPEFSASIELGRADQVKAVERALFQRATGFKCPAVKIMTVPQGMGLPSVIEKVEYTEHYPPDPESMKFFLKNKNPTEWREKQEVEHSGKMTLEQILSGSMDQEQANADKPSGE
jgi:hypothetical protein